jgi:hypothetical protein
VLCIFYELNLFGVYSWYGTESRKLSAKIFPHFYRHIPLVQLRKVVVLGNLNSHSFGTILSPFPIFLCVWSRNHGLSSITATFLPLHHVNIHLNKFRHLKDGNISLFQNVRTFNHCTMQKPYRRSLLDK